VWTVGSGSYQFAWNLFPAPAADGTAGNGRVTLNWAAVPDVAGYNVKRSTTSGREYTLVAGGVNCTNYTDLRLSNYTNYYYVVSASAPAARALIAGSRRDSRPDF